MSTYASSTSVSVEKSRGEIERTLQRYGASAFMYGWNGDSAVIAFEMRDRQIRFALPLPPRDSKEFWYTPAKRSKRTPEAALKLWEQACRQRWRALALVVKAKLEAVESGITTFEDEFLAHTVLPGGAVVRDWLQPQIDIAYQTGAMPDLLPVLKQKAIPATTGGDEVVEGRCTECLQFVAYCECDDG